MTKKTGKSYKQNALELFQSRIGKVVTSEELAEVPGKNGKVISHNIRRIFELRDEMGYEIVNHNNNHETNLNLKVNEWVLLLKDPNPKKIRSRGVNKRIRYDVFERDGFTCVSCGRTPQDDDPLNSNRKITLHVGHKVAHKNTDKNQEVVKNLKVKDFITQCNVCNEGAKNKNIKRITLADRVMKAPKVEKKKIYLSLKKEFN